MNTATDVIEVIARIYKTPTLRLARAVSLAKGTTAITSTTGANMATGTIENKIRSAVLGVKSSLKISFTKSAKG